jgi:gibberellin 20-oxidase
MSLWLQRRSFVAAMQAYFEGQMKVEDFATTGEDRPTTPHDVFDETLPVVDIAAIKGLGSEEERQANVAVMLEAAKSWGFFQISSHGIPLEAVRQVEAHVKEFFALPMERKLRARASDTESLFGYTAGSPMKWTSKWWLEALHLKVKDDVLEDLVTKAFPDEPQHAARFKHDLKAFLDPVHELARFLVEELTQALGLKRDTFTRLEVTQSNSAGRMNHYPVCPDPDSVLGIPGHTDLLMTTILHQADASGLQVLKDGRWVGIRPEKSTLVVNIGDTFM